MTKEYNSKEAAEFIDVCPRTLTNIRSKKQIPFTVKKVPVTTYVESAIFLESDLVAFKEARDAKRNPAPKTSRQTQSAEGSL